MTRVNCAILPSELSTKHIIAELREIKRIPNQVFSKGDKLNLKDIPKEFKLNKGHVRFFYDKLGYLYKRYQSLYNEAKNVRGFDVSDYSDCFLKAIKVRNDLNNDYEESMRDRSILIERLKERDYEFYKNLL